MTHMQQQPPPHLTHKLSCHPFSSTHDLSMQETQAPHTRPERLTVPQRKMTLRDQLFAMIKVRHPSARTAE
jgi:hypothetical protein